MAKEPTLKFELLRRRASPWIESRDAAAMAVLLPEAAKDLKEARRRP